MARMPVPGPSGIHSSSWRGGFLAWDFGFYWLHRSSFERWTWPAAFSLENDFFQRHLAELDLRGTVTDGHFIDIGVPEEFDRALIDIPRWQSA